MRAWLLSCENVVTSARELIAFHLYQDEYSLWESYLYGCNFLAGDQFTLADAKVAPTMMLANRFGCQFTKYPNIKDYLEHIKVRER